MLTNLNTQKSIFESLRTEFLKFLFLHINSVFKTYRTMCLNELTVFQQKRGRFQQHFIE